MTKDRRLGRGLAALLGSPLGDGTDDSGAAPTSGGKPPAPVAAAGVEHHVPELLHLNVAEIDENPFQPRRDFWETEIASLSESLKEHDLLQPAGPPSGRSVPTDIG